MRRDTQLDTGSGEADDTDRHIAGDLVGGKYRILRILGKGGMGHVYEAEHAQIGRRVAIKVLSPLQAHRPEAIARLWTEARAAGSVQHPNVCEIYDIGLLRDETPYLVMELVCGRTVAQRIAHEGALPFHDVVAILAQVLSGLDAAHSKNIIHRDLKPENIALIDRLGCPVMVKLLDFGVSKIRSTDGPASITRSGFVVGTPYYMAPEQVRGLVLDQRVDLYACGVVLYECLTGRRPFAADNYKALAMQILSAEVPDPREHRPALPQGFVPILSKALARDREERYADARLFLHDLLALDEEVARGPSRAEIARMIRQLADRTNHAQDSEPSAAPESSDIPVYVTRSAASVAAVKPAMQDEDDDVTHKQDRRDVLPLAQGAGRVQDDDDTEPIARRGHRAPHSEPVSPSVPPETERMDDTDRADREALTASRPDANAGDERGTPVPNGGQRSP